ncbi:single-stranded DNA-binding protein [Lyngbya confervoides]|uniref:Single-stranded DNA-binding protein n=1 Tax=Lyngbya confervoides BDU141951 TaxID=1574623 RepID=A0ABD4TAF9_9CYAN|nr:single-stranded DNA-binding protein [Lyngbya confervoides]MCM1985135.1 single-stranded DNA-binding protein [Lyngbya confervoides BDU141951]
MNSCVFMAEVVKAPELRYTQDGQMAIAEMMVHIDPLRADDPKSPLKVVAWGNLGQQVQEQVREGDTVILEGRLAMNTIDRPEGYKEKVAEMTISRLHPVGAGMSLSGGSSSGLPSSTQSKPVGPSPASASPATVVPAMPSPPPAVETDFDDIPF